MNVYITGGSSGIGLEAARVYARQGANVVILSSGESAGRAALATLCAVASAPSQRIAWIAANVSDRQRVQDAFAEAVHQVGPPDIVLHMAGIGGVCPHMDMPYEDFDRMMRVNIYGTRHVVEASLTHMVALGRGRIVLAGSLAGAIPVYGYTAYGTSKFAVHGFAQCLRCETKPLNVSVHLFAPGQVDTPGLEAEYADSHPAAAALKLLGGTISTERAVAALLDGIAAGRFLIIPGWRCRLLYWLCRITPISLWNAVTDLLVSRALKPRPGAVH